MRIHVKDASIRNEILSQLVSLKTEITAKLHNAPKPNVLVIDDDPLFLRMVHRAAESEQIDVTECSSLADVDSIAVPGMFDVAIVDYYLDGITKALRGPGLAKQLAPTPTILVSQKEECMAEFDPWPENVRFYLNKGNGPHALLQAALKYRGDTRGRS